MENHLWIQPPRCELGTGTCEMNGLLALEARASEKDVRDQWDGQPKD
jgi:hypothetical protein